MKKLAVLIGVVAIFAWGTGAWANLTFGTWTTKNTYYPVGGATSPTIFTGGVPGLSAALTDVGTNEVDLTISSNLTGAYASDDYTNFILNFDPSYTGTLPLSFTIISPTTTTLTIVASADAAWPPPSGSGAGVAIGTADILITPSTPLAGISTLVIEIQGTGNLTNLTSAMFAYQMQGGTPASNNGNFFGATLDNGLTGASEAYGGVVAKTTPMPTSALLFLTGLGGFAMLKRRVPKA